MKILLVGMPSTYDYLVPLFEREGATVKVITGMENGNTLCLQFARPKDTEYVLAEIESFNPDFVVNAITRLILPESDDYVYLGNTELSARLETQKRETRAKAGELGWLLPEVLEDCTLLTVSEHPQTRYVKPSDNTTHMPTIKLPGGTDVSNMFAGARDYPCFVERGVDYAVEAFCYFIIANGEYSIVRTIGVDGYGNDKLWERGGDDWRPSIVWVDLTTEQHEAFTAKCENWLSYAATLGGNYEGSIGGAISSDLSVYWFEQNSRPDTYDIGTIPATAALWLDSLTHSPSTGRNQLSAVETVALCGFGGPASD